MRLFNWLFGKSNMRCVKPANEVFISRGPKAVHAITGSERETFIREAAKVLNLKPEELDLNRDLQRDYAYDELDILECIQIAEDIWNVSIIPSPYSSDISVKINKYNTLAIILETATKSVGREDLP